MYLIKTLCPFLKNEPPNCNRLLWIQLPSSPLEHTILSGDDDYLPPTENINHIILRLNEVTRLILLSRLDHDYMPPFQCGAGLR